MHRQSGRPLKKDYYVELELLPDNQLFSASEITNRKYDKNSNLESHQRMFHAIYQFSVRNGINLAPDNCLRRPGGKPLFEDGKVCLKPGHRSARWYGKTWKSKLYIEDRIAFKKYMVEKFLLVLSQIQTVKAKVARARPLREDHMKPEKRRFAGILSVRHRWWLAVALMATILFTAGAAYNYSFLRQGFHVLRHQGSKAAFEFFQNHGENFDHLFGKAWSAYRMGRYEEARDIGLRVYASPDLKDKARAAYLLGDLNTIKGHWEAAEEYLLTAQAIYESTGKKKSLFRTRMFLAKLQLAKRDIDNAQYYLNLAGATYPANNDHFFLYLRSQVAFHLNDFERALDFSLQREKVFNGDQSQLITIYSDIGLYYGLLGNQVQCIDYTIKAESLAARQEDAHAIMYNNINMYLYQKCTFDDYSTLRESILAYARRKKEQRLMELVHFIDKFPCPIFQAGTGHGDPPDDPDEPPTESPERRQSPLAEAEKGQRN